jgi:hypothetical protein
MKQIILFIILSFVVTYTYSQDTEFIAPDYDLIKSEVQDSMSIFFYPAILAKLTAYDPSLTSEEYRHLYYGYIFQDKYKPYWTSPDEIELIEYYHSRKIKEKDYDKIIKLATHSISEFPFDLRQMNFLAYIYHLKGDEESAGKVSARFAGTLGAIMSTGDGKTCETAYHVISVSHEYVMLNMFQFNFLMQSLTGDCDLLSVEKDDRNINGIYFNVRQLFNRSLENLKSE